MKLLPLKKKQEKKKRKRSSEMFREKTELDSIKVPLRVLSSFLERGEIGAFKT